MKYIAYGSNMVRKQMSLRCPEAKMIGTGHIHGARLEFYLHATVQKTGDELDWVPAVLWEISEQDERNLDSYEGFPKYYGKEEWPVTMNDGTEVRGMIYLMKQFRNLPPTNLYYNSITEAYRELGLEEEIPLVLEPALERSRSRRNDT